jgi:hypothetical protein
MPAAQIVHCSETVRDSRALATRFLDLVEWRVPPAFAEQGRTSWSTPPAPIDCAASVTGQLRAFKLKGAGLCDAAGAVRPPDVDRSFRQSNQHVGIDEAGQFRMLTPEESPLGGIFLDRAEAEYRNAAALVAVRCPSIVPIAVYRYTELDCPWQPGRPLGAVLTASPVADDRRATVLFEADVEQRLPTIEAMAREYGRSLRLLHEAGLFRHNGYPSNYLFPPQLRTVVLVDLDSCRSLAECGPVRRPLEILRDIAGGFFNLGAAVLKPDWAHRFAPAELIAHDPFGAFLRGYFGYEAPAGSSIVSSFHEHLLPRLAGIRGALGQRYPSTEARRGALRGFRMNRRQVYATLMADLVEPYQESALSLRIPLELKPAEVRQRATAFVGDEER